MSTVTSEAPEGTVIVDSPIPALLPKRAIDYKVSDLKIAELADKYKDCRADTPDGYKMVVGGLREVRGLRNGVENLRVDLKKESLAYGKKVDSEARRIREQLEAIEEPLKASKKAIDDAEAIAKQEKIDAENARLAKIEQDRLDEEDRVRQEEQAKIKAEQEKENARLKKFADELEERRLANEVAAEKARLELEKENKAKQEREDVRLKKAADKLEQERQSNEAALEKERLIQAAKDRVLQEDFAKKQAEHDAKVKADSDAAAEKQRLRDEEFEQERLRLVAEREVIELKGREAKAAEQARIDEQARLEREAEDKKQAAVLLKEKQKRLEAMRPDVEKVRALIKVIEDLEFPVVKDSAMADMLLAVDSDIMNITSEMEQWCVNCAPTA